MKNNEIRFRTETSFKSVVDTLREKEFEDLVKSSFYEKIFLLGFNQLLLQIQKNGQEEALNFLMKTKK